MSNLSLQIYFVSNSSGCIYHSNYYWKHWIDYWLLRNLLSHQPWHVHYFIMRDGHKCVLLLIWKVYSHMKWNAASFLAKSSNFFVISAYSSISHIHSEYPLWRSWWTTWLRIFFFLWAWLYWQSNVHMAEIFSFEKKKPQWLPTSPLRAYSSILNMRSSFMTIKN